MLPIYKAKTGPYHSYNSVDRVLCAAHGYPLYQIPRETIVRASRNFEGAAWSSYDAAYRRLATNQQSWDWATIDITIYNEAFTGRARLLPRCRYCLAETHEARHCQYAPRDEPPLAKQPKSGAGGRGAQPTTGLPV